MEFDEKDFKEKCKAIYSEVSASENLKYKVLHAAVSEEKGDSVGAAQHLRLWRQLRSVCYCLVEVLSMR